MKWYFTALRKGLTFRGRARRKEYWYFFLFNFLVAILLSFVDLQMGWMSADLNSGILSGIYSLLIIVPSLAVSVRRLHDSDRTGWWALLLFVPLIGFLILLFFFAKDGTMGDNRFGADPKEICFNSLKF